MSNEPPSWLFEPIPKVTKFQQIKWDLEFELEKANKIELVLLVLILVGVYL